MEYDSIAEVLREKAIHPRYRDFLLEVGRILAKTDMMNAGYVEGFIERDNRYPKYGKTFKRKNVEIISSDANGAEDRQNRTERNPKTDDDSFSSSKEPTIVEESGQ